MMKFKINIILIFFLSVLLLTAQDGGTKRWDLTLLPGNDTLITYHFDGDWWYGVNTGFVGIYNYGDLIMPWHPREEQSLLNPLIAYHGNTGDGYFFGLEFEWMPPHEIWGGQLRVYFADTRTTKNISDSIGNSDIIQTPFVSGVESTINYIAVSPSIRYNFRESGFYAFGGGDIEIPIASKMKETRNFEHSGEIEWLGPLSVENLNLRYGVHFGLGFDFYGGSISTYRAKFSPYISFNIENSVTGIHESTWNNVYGRLGFSLKFGPDKITYDTLLLDENYFPPPITIADSRSMLGVTYPNYKTNEFLASNIEYVPEPKLVNNFSEYPSNQVNLSLNTKIEKPKQEKQIAAGDTARYDFKTASSSSLSRNLEVYLDNLADFMKKNPYVEIRIVGHSDNSGTPSENQRRSEVRAQAVVKYLVSKGIKRERLLDRAVGDRFGIATNDTEAGRRKNRRVDIIVVQ